MSNYLKSRSFLAHNVDTILDGLIAARTMKKNDSDDLFANPNGQSSQVTVAWKKLERVYSKREILAAEKESLGIYVSGSALEDYVELVHWCREITARDDIYLVIIDKVKKIFTKSGVMMFALQLTTLDLEVEGVIFPKKAMHLSSVLAEKELFWIRGNIQQTKRKQEKVEAVDSETELDVEKETGEQLKEYEELPKLIVENIVPFENGLLSVFEGDEKSSLSMNRRDKIAHLDWSKLKDSPHNLELLFNESQVNQYNQRTLSNSSYILVIYLAKTLGIETLKNIKADLKSDHFDGAVQVYVEVESKEGFKRAKTTYWIPPDLYEKYKHKQ